MGKASAFRPVIHPSPLVAHSVLERAAIMRTSKTPLRPGPALRSAGFRQDPDAAARALGVEGGAAVLVIDALGGSETAFGLLARYPAQVVVGALVDPEGVSGRVAFEVAAHRTLPRRDALRLLGHLRASRSDRARLLEQILPTMPPLARAFWEPRARIGASGCCCSSAEADLGKVLRSLLCAHLTGEDYRTLLYSPIPERLGLFDARIGSSPFWRATLRRCRSRLELDPGTRGNAFVRGDPIQELRRMVELGLWTSPVWARAFCTDAGVMATLPAHLRPLGWAALKDRLSHGGPEVRPLAESFTLAPADGFDAIDLGGALDLCTDAERDVLLARTRQALRRGGRLSLQSVACPRQLLGFSKIEAACVAARGYDRAPVRGDRHIFEAV